MNKGKILRNQILSKNINNKFKDKDWAKKLERVSGKNVDISINSKYLYMLIDCSSSMSDNDKIQQAKNGSITFANNAIEKKYKVGVISFSSEAKLILKIEESTASIHNTIKQLYTEGSTNLADALLIAQEELSDKYGEKILCVVTDGMPNNSKLALEISKKLHSEGIDIMAIGTDDADQIFLEKLCNRKEFSIKVESHQLIEGIKSMTKMLTGPSD